jgi:hypothetical protein
MWDYDVKTRKRKALTYPDFWLKELIKYNELEPEPPRRR